MSEPLVAPSGPAPYLETPYDGRGYAIGAVVVATSPPYLPPLPRQLGLGVLMAGLAVHVVGTVIATLTPSALTWHQENVRARARRTVKSLADWRRDPG